MKLFNYLKLAVVFSILIFAFSCSDNENLDEVIEPELELMGRGNAFTEDGIIVKNDLSSDDDNQENDDNFLDFNYQREFCFIEGLSISQKQEAINCYIFPFNTISRVSINGNCEVWLIRGEHGDPVDDEDEDEDEDLILKKSSIIEDFHSQTKGICNGILSTRIILKD
ncbi:hypothetical protein [Tenacibaculum jejuense]|uniref:Probable lipoprotein n=1 Tax=Tenacibaculum jejuense TaxID=584609 RepID=A0A238U7J9_9FLAO|nr:hypothetical protein [Tenacibaculum jejuense]SNR14986.1 Probable lipoprotein precursor [Tenacibaculum jejuense]